MPFLIFYTQIKQVHQDKPTSLHSTPSCFFIPIISFTSSLPFAGAAYKVNEVIHFSFTAPSLFRSFLKIELLVIQTFRNRKIKNNDSFKKVRFTLKKVKLTFSKVSRVFRKISREKSIGFRNNSHIKKADHRRAVELFAERLKDSYTDPFRVRTHAVKVSEGLKTREGGYETGETGHFTI